MKREPEFSRVFALHTHDAESTNYTIKASVEECKNLAHRFELLSIDNLEAHLQIEKGTEAGSFHVKGQLEADIVQACILSLRDVKNHISIHIDLLLLPHSHKIFQDQQDMDYTQDYEPLMGEQVDLGEIVAQYLSLSLNPYPKHPDTPDEHIDSEPYLTSSHRPFGDLARLRVNQKK